MLCISARWESNLCLWHSCIIQGGKWRSILIEDKNENYIRIIRLHCSVLCET
uniref:Uncharacterized protein n=1 Tax=Rhizophora mucronata TaxID=61149 RepID=A0A2P2QJR4_RHIMU